MLSVVILNVVMLSVFMLSVFKLSVVILKDVMLSVVILSVVMPLLTYLFVTTVILPAYPKVFVHLYPIVKLSNFFS